MLKKSAALLGVYSWARLLTTLAVITIAVLAIIGVAIAGFTVTTYLIRSKHDAEVAR